MSSFSLILNTQRATQNTAGIDYTWAHDFSSIEPGPYEVSFCFYSNNILGLVDFSTLPTPNLCLDLQQSTNVYAPDTSSAQHTSKVIGVLKTVLIGTNLACFQSDTNSNPPFFISHLGTNVNTIRMFVVQPGTLTLIGTSLTSWTAVLYFRKV